MSRAVVYRCDRCDEPVLPATGGTTGGLVVDVERFDPDPVIGSEYQPARPLGDARRVFFCSRECAALYFGEPAR